MVDVVETQLTGNITYCNTTPGTGFPTILWPKHALIKVFVDHLKIQNPVSWKTTLILLLVKYVSSYAYRTVNVSIRILCNLEQYMDHAKQNCDFRHAHKEQIHIHPAHAQIHPGICAPLITFYNVQWFVEGTVKTLIRLRGSAGWSGPSLSDYARSHVFARRRSCVLVSNYKLHKCNFFYWRW